MSQMDNRDKLIEKQKELINELIEWLDSECPSVALPLESYTTADLSHDFAEKLREKLDILSYNKELSTLEKEVPEEKPQKYEPYFGWCDVSGCKNEGCSGGMAWRKTGYWTVCSEHSKSSRKGDMQPKMKQSAIEREKSRDKVTGYLTH